MADNKNEALLVALILASSIKAESPGQILYGYAKLMSMQDDRIKAILPDYLDQDEKSRIVKDIDDAKKVFEEKGISLENLSLTIKRISSAKLLAPVSDEYKALFASYDGSVSSTKIVSDALAALTDEEKQLIEDSQSEENFEKVIEKIEDTAKTVKAVEDKKKLEEDIENILSKDMKDYLESIKKAIPVFQRMNLMPKLLGQNILLSIDDGFGTSFFLSELAKIYITEGICLNTDCKDAVLEAQIPEKREKEDVYGEMLSSLKKVMDQEKGQYHYKSDDKTLGIFCFDISKILDSLATSEIRLLIKKITELFSPYIIVFRAPFLEKGAIENVKNALLDVAAIQTVEVSSISMDMMKEYISRKIAESGFALDDQAGAVIEAGIVNEKNDGHFYGFKTLNKMTDSIIYKKVMNNSQEGSTDTVISKNQLADMLEVTMDITQSDADFDKLIGLEDVKAEVEKKIKQLKVQIDMAGNGKTVDRPSIHMMFTGNPGTGKTTMARIVAKMLKEAGVLSKGNFFEIKGRDLCGRYVGETTPKTVSICRDAYGSVLFIDEAYELFRGDSPRDYGHEAIAALIAEMENHRDDMCVIFAGYEDEMNVFLEGNPGLPGRIPVHINFPNYTKDELEEIFFKMMDGNFKYDEGLKNAVHKFFSSIPDRILEDSRFDNGRFVRNLYEKVWGEAAVHYDVNSGDELIIKKSDFENVIEKQDFDDYKETPRRRIGFITDEE